MSCGQRVLLPGNRPRSFSCSIVCPGAFSEMNFCCKSKSACLKAEKVCEKHVRSPQPRIVQWRLVRARRNERLTSIHEAALFIHFSRGNSFTSRLVLLLDSVLVVSRLKPGETHVLQAFQTYLDISHPHGTERTDGRRSTSLTMLSADRR